MTTVPTEAQLSDKECDDLTVFNQIKLDRQQWLRKSLDICTYADLAALSVDQIASQAKADNLLLARKWIEEWIAEAQKLAAAADPTSRRTVEAANRTAEAPPTAAQELGEWRRFAAFVVDFQARGVEEQKEELRIEVRHYPMDEKGSWLDNHGPLHVEVVRGEDLYPWMLDQLGQGAQQLTESASNAMHKPRPGVASETTAPQLHVEITQIRAFQPPLAGTPVAVGAGHQPFRGSLKSGEPFALEATFELTGDAAADAAKEKIPYHAEFHVRALPVGETTPLGNTERKTLSESSRSYSAKLPDVVLPPGMYRLHVVTVLECAPPVIRYLKVPVLHVA